MTELQNLLKFVWDSPYSDFYRKKYESAGFGSQSILKPENFKNIPYLTRQELETTPALKRLFINREDVQFIAYTSGTSSQNPLITYFSEVENYFFDPALAIGVKKLLITYPPLNKNFGHTFIQQCRQSPTKPLPIFADFQNLANSAIIAAKTEIDAIYATPTIAAMLAEFLQKYYDIAKIKLLALSSETLTPARREQLKNLYPEAKIANLYASSEIGQFVLYPCPEIINSGKDLFHVLTPPVLEAEIIGGEMVITYGANKAMPLIRYRTGDFFEIEKEKCACGKSPVLKWSGRKDVDKIRAGGAEIKTEDVETAFQKINYITGDKYQIHFYEIEDNGKNKIKAVVEIAKTEEEKRIIGSLENAKSTVISHLLNNWQIGAGLLKDAVEKGFFCLPEVNFKDRLSLKSLKTRRIISHLNEN